MGISTTKEGADKAKAELGCKFKTKDSGEVSLVLRIKIGRDREAGTISILQSTDENCLFLAMEITLFLKKINYVLIGKAMH